MSQSSSSKNKIISIEELRGAADLKDVTKTITLADKPYIDMFYTEPYPYYMNAVHNVMATHWQVRYTIVSIDEDMVLVAYKNVSFFAVKYYRLLFHPKSIGGNRANEDAVYEELIKHEKVTEVVTQEPHGKPFDHDFYINAKEKFAEIDRSKYRSKHRINILKRDPEFEVRLATNDDRVYIKFLLDRWKEFKGKDYSGAVFKGFLKYYDKWVNNGNTKVIVMTYGGFIVGLYVYAHTINNNWYQIINVAYNRKNFPVIGTDENFLKLLTDTSQISLYFTLEMLHDTVDLITFAGGRIPSLVKYKKRVYKNFTPYYRKKLNE